MMAYHTIGDALHALDRAAEALGFRLQAAERFRMGGGAWYEAHACLGAADAAAHLQLAEAEELYLQWAHNCLNSYTDLEGCSLATVIANAARQTGPGREL